MASSAEFVWLLKIIFIYVHKNQNDFPRYNLCNNTRITVKFNMFNSKIAFSKCESKL